MQIDRKFFHTQVNTPCGGPRLGEFAIYNMPSATTAFIKHVRYKLKRLQRLIRLCHAKCRAKCCAKRRAKRRAKRHAKCHKNLKINIINEDVLKISENLISKQKLIVFGNLPYNISTKILSKWIISTNKSFWFSKLILMFQKEVADRIISKINTSNYGRLSILSNWKLDIEKVMDISRNSFFPKPKVESTLLIFSPKNKFYKIKNSNNLEMITRIFFNQRRKMIKKPFGQIFKNPNQIAKKLNINLNLRPQNISLDNYYKITKEYENLRC